MLSKLGDRTRPLSVIWLTVMWILLMGELTWGNFFAGLALALAIVWLLPLPPVPLWGIRLNLWELLKFGVHWLWELIVASVKVSWLAIRPADPPMSAIFVVPMRLATELELYFAACAYNLQPGGCVTDFDLANRTWTIHVLDAHTQKDIERELANVAKLERSMLAIFEGTRS
ncbi:Na+/H+ antiporter subunit E [Corynebacterium aquatimens]|uniref:Multicomponent Na+:H+ antiporter subunit E n=1 Tax=Corynebacterium aquatimens TaxID=1190508 RepID=A0A931E228_9CORY|nr:Na+/H+ antiporter subunit E [Corynebacterium aquatimens]MBG6122376.1 multicomponent Na+:H+ antiporter subunit E [Corynebacterium aquatimens]WJY65081.1 Na(+)/H(+) antiporter subunit E [Corynebacterium aquatimens]